MTRAPTTALVLETNNLRADGSRAFATLERLLKHLRGQSRPLDALDELVVTHDGFSREECDALGKAAGRGIRFVEMPASCGYYEAKNRGFEATRADRVAFGDADCWPEGEWLERLFAPLEDPAGPDAVAGRTTYRSDLLGTAASAIDFMYFGSPLGPGCTRNFYANNVAFRREVFETHRYQGLDGVYRGHCQVLGLRLQAAGVKIHFEPRARTVHRFPDSVADFVRLRWLRGQDTVGLTPHLAEAYLPPRWRWLGEVPFASVGVLTARLGFSLRALNHQDLPAVHGLKWLGTAGVVGALSALDTLGAVQRTFVRPRASRDLESLSYHADRDRLGPQRGEYPGQRVSA